MKPKSYFLTFIFFWAFKQNFAQNLASPFVVEVLHVNERICFGTIISERHVLTAASCVESRGDLDIRILVMRYAVREISIHPRYRSGRQGSSNVAILSIDAEFETQNLPLLPTQSLPSNSTCSLFGWGQPQWGVMPRSVPVSIYNSQFCDPEVPGVSCSVFPTNTAEACMATIGSPVLCDGNTRFTGIMTSAGCNSRNNDFAITYESVNVFQNWIQEVFRANATGNSLNENAVTNIMEFISGNIASQRIRCRGAVINENHVLTTATCVTLPENSNFVIGVQAHFSGLGFATVESSEIFIHPNFSAGQSRLSNIAVIRVNQNFNLFGSNRALSLGNLPTTNGTYENLCQIVPVGARDFFENRPVIAVHSPQFCYNNLPQVFCSVIDTGSQSLCTAMQGAPVLCGEKLAIAGIILTNRECSRIGDTNVLDFHSVGEFSEWIEEITSASELVKIPTILILIAVLINTKNFL